MVGRNPFLTAVAVGSGTMVALGGSTIVVSAVGIALAKRVARARKLKSALSCCQCNGEGYLPCDVCLRTCIVRCREPKSIRDIMLETKQAKVDRGLPGADRAADPSVPPVYCSCPACGTSGYQRCMNCLGDGKV
jgi:hypothetical protein